jgi:hypothetical protein
MILRVSDERGATVQGAVRQLEKNPRDKRAIRRLVMALTATTCSTEEGLIIAEF